MILALPFFHLSPPKIANAWVKEAFEAFAGSRVRKNGARKLAAIQLSFFGDHLLAERGADFRQSRLAGLNHGAGEVIGIDHGHVAGAKQLSAGGFAHPDTAGQAEDFHSRKLKP